MRDVYNNIEIISAIPPETISGTRTSEIVDLQGFDGASFLFHTGAETGGAAFTADIQHSDISNSDFVSVGAEDLQSTAPFNSLVSDNVDEVGYLGNKRYLRVVLTKTAGTNMLASVTVIKAHAQARPVA